MTRQLVVSPECVKDAVGPISYLLLVISCHTLSVSTNLAGIKIILVQKGHRAEACVGISAIE